MAKRKLKDNISSAEEFAHYQSVIRGGLIKANTDPLTQMHVRKLCDNIAELFKQISLLQIDIRRNPRNFTAKEKIEKNREEIQEALTTLNHNYLMELLMGDFTK